MRGLAECAVEVAEREQSQKIRGPRLVGTYGVDCRRGKLQCLRDHLAVAADGGDAKGVTGSVGTFLEQPE
ncbi:Uncharacterised protein [Mycobacteroides abscessus subsp. abscessus]|nr:Uncharacterised protein [Mycobacteroides abscessus subsp. abscessus]